jgi:hypothetical protein
MTDAELAEARLAALLDAERENTALIAEVERLRAERHLDNVDLAQAYDFARNKGETLEREAVVSWLRRNPGVSRAPECVTAMTPFECADAIERGEHRRKETT